MQKRASVGVGVLVPVGLVVGPKLGFGMVPKLGVPMDGVEKDGEGVNVEVGVQAAFPKNVFTRVRVRYQIISPGMTTPVMLL